MAMLDEVSKQLMKPAKDLADWSFPLSTVLENYYTLLNAQDDVNFSNAALVLQNSANVYVRRVEYLYHDTSALNQSFAENESADKTSKDEKNRTKSVHKLIELEDFETIDFGQFVGKNNNLKDRNETNNSVKLLDPRFPQLENVSRISLPIEVYDVHGEVIGNKYDFRCNEYLTPSGKLVRHLTPKDFERTTCDDACEDSGAVQEKETGLLNETLNTSIDSGLGSSIQGSNIHTSSPVSIFAENHWERSVSCPESSVSAADPTTPTAMEDDNGFVDDDSADEREDTGDGTVGCDPQTRCNFQSSPTEAVVPDVRRSKRMSNAIDAVNDLNPTLWEPIPFNGVPDKLAKISRTEFKLPCSVSQLKCRERTRKRKSTSETRKRRCLERLSTIESGTGQKKITMYSPTRQLFHLFKKEEIEDFELYSEYELEKRTNIDGFGYEAVTDISMDLLGFRTQVRKNDGKTIAPVESDFQTNVGKSGDRTADIAVTRTVEPTENTDASIESPVDDFPMPETPESSDSSSEMETPTSARLSSHQSRIEKSVREIYDSADARTAQEVAVAEWHEFMKPKLREAERRPLFDISEYSARVMRTIEAETDRKIEFKRIVNDREPLEVARYFFTSLQLANNNNVFIDTSRNVGGNFTLELIDKGKSDNT